MVEIPEQVPDKVGDCGCQPSMVTGEWPFAPDDLRPAQIECFVSAESPMYVPSQVAVPTACHILPTVPDFETGLDCLPTTFN